MATKNPTNPTNPTQTKEDTIRAKKIVDTIDAIRATTDGVYVRNGVKLEELDAIKAAIAHVSPLMDSSIDAAGGVKANYLVNITRYHVASSAWQTVVSIPVSVHSSKVCPAGDKTPTEALEWFVPATAADFKAATTNSNRVHAVTIDGKVVSLKGNAKTGEPVRTKISLAKFFKEHVGAAMRDALFAALPDASINHDTDVSIKARRWDVVLVPTKQVSVSVKH